MSRDSRIAYIINQLGELRELLLVIEQAGNTSPDILLKLAREKAESIDRSVRELRSPRFWAELQNHDPFSAISTATPSTNSEETDSFQEQIENIPEHDEADESHTSRLPHEESVTAEEPLGYPWDIPATSESSSEAKVESEDTSELETRIEGEPQISDEEESAITGEVHEEAQPESPTTDSSEEPAEEDTLYPWEQMSDEELAAQNDKVDYDDETDYDDEADDPYEYGHTDYEDTPEADLPPEGPSGTVTLEEALQRQQAKELRKALSLNDRFRFRRELFGNSDIRMNETLALIDAMNSYDEAEDYILNDLNWDIENPEVAEFMKIVQKHFL